MAIQSLWCWRDRSLMILIAGLSQPPNSDAAEMRFRQLQPRQTKLVWRTGRKREIEEPVNQSAAMLARG
jgi:hypothetical protein